MSTANYADRVKQAERNYKAIVNIIGDHPTYRGPDSEMMAKFPYAHVRFGLLMFRQPRRVMGYVAPTASVWHDFYIVDDFGNLTQSHVSLMRHYVQQDHDEV